MKKLMLIGILLLVLISSAIAVYVLSQPSDKAFTDKEREERLEKMLGRNVSFTNTTRQGDTYYDGSTISFIYPAKAEVYEYREEGTTPDSNALDDFSFDLRDPRAIFNLKVIPTHLSSLDDVPAVRLRELRLGEYKKANSSLDGLDGIYYYKEKEEPEITSFFLDSGKLYSISITGTSHEYIQALFDSILSSAKLK